MPDLSGTAGKNAPLWTDEAVGSEVIYDRSFDMYLAVYQTGLFPGSDAGFKVQASNDLIHWSEPIGDPGGRDHWRKAQNDIFHGIYNSTKGGLK
jgi:hypothetical protein